jgi:hypothetical protein
MCKIKAEAITLAKPNWNRFCVLKGGFSADFKGTFTEVSVRIM